MNTTINANDIEILVNSSCVAVYRLTWPCKLADVNSPSRRLVRRFENVRLAAEYVNSLPA